LIIVVGLLCAVAVMAVSFARAAMMSRLSARSFANHVAAEELCRTAVSRAMESVRETCAGYAYPCWISEPPAFRQDALSSWTPGGEPSDSLLRGEAADHVPRALWSDASAAASNAVWIPVLSNAQGRVTGRIAFLVVNCSGLLDANTVGGQPQGLRVDPSELDLSSLPDMAGGSNDFLYCREQDGRYETLPDLAANGALCGPPSNLFVYSFDPNPDAFFTETDSLGSPFCPLENKIPLNCAALVDSPVFDVYSANSNFMRACYSPLASAISNAGIPNADAVAWNIINYTDPNRIPQSDDPSPWIAGPVEDVPLINEIIVRPVATNGAGPATNEYEVVVELWYPFVPREVSPEDEFEIQVAVSENPVPSEICSSSNDILRAASSNWSFRLPVSSMIYGTATEFLCFTSPPSARISFTDGTNLLPLSETRPIWLMVRVAQNTPQGVMPVDQAMSATNFFRVTAPAAWSVNDPRLNGSEEYWTTQPPTPGAMNAGCDPLAHGGEGVPIFHRDSAMLSAAEVGRIHSLQQPWRNLDIMGGAAPLLDRLTARPAPVSAKGRIAVSSAQPEVLKCLFHGLSLGWSNSVVSESCGLDPSRVNNLVSTLIENGPYQNFADLFSINTVAEAFAAAVDPAAPPCDFFREGALCAIAEMLTFRQNLLTVIAAAQVLGSDGKTVLAERRSVSIVARDSYTGAWFVRNQKWLSGL